MSQSSAVPGAPVIGISTYSVHADWTAWAGQSALTPRTYVDCVFAAGGLPILLPSLPPEPTLLDRLIDQVDAVVLVGGEDVCGVWSGREEAAEVHATHSDERDAFEIALAKRVWERDVALLGICRGAQILNVSRGGTLIEDLPSSGASPEHLIEWGTFNPHPVDFEEGSLAAGMFGPCAEVPSHHHQAIDALGEDLVVTGRAADSVIESVEAPHKHFLLGVQWHPEEEEDITIFEALVEATAVRA